MLPDIDSLKLFVQAAELGSLTKAAEASNIGLAGASRRIMLLEARFKTALFDRSPRGMTLTPAGNWLLAQARVVLTQMNEMQLIMKDFASGRQGALRILANPSVILESFPKDLADFSRANIDIELIVEERWSEEIGRAILESEADVGIIVDGTSTDGLQTFTYRTDHLAVLAPAGHAIQKAADVRFKQVLEYDLITLESGSSMMRLLSEQAMVADVAFLPRMQVRSLEAICRMVQAGLGIGVLPFEVAESLSAGRGLILRPLKEGWAERKMFVCVRTERTCNPVLAKLVKHLASCSVSWKLPERSEADLAEARPHRALQAAASNRTADGAAVARAGFLSQAD